MDYKTKVESNENSFRGSRRTFMKGTAASLAFGSLGANSASALAKSVLGESKHPFSKNYGPLSPTTDLATGLDLLALPEGFIYQSYGWTGQTMSDGRPTPTDHDGMAVVSRRGSRICLVRNHELSADEGPRCTVPGGEYNFREWGGTTSLVFNLETGRFEKSWVSLGGTIRNCAGGPTPWGSWLSCEETFHKWNEHADAINHGYIFEVPGFGIATGQPIRAAGRFKHEAVAVDPATSFVYETEDTGESAFYRYVPPVGGNGSGVSCQKLEDGGKLYAMVVNNTPRFDLRGGFMQGAEFQVTWQLVEDPEAKEMTTFQSATDAAIISRGEGCWADKGKIYFVSTDGGTARLGQVWAYDPLYETLTLVYESTRASDVDGPDNIAISPRGGVILCEDGDSNPKRLIGLDNEGRTFEFAKNNIQLNQSTLTSIGKQFPGVAENFWDELNADGSMKSFMGREWAGATFYGEWLFVNIQSPGVTFAITGPWSRGFL